MNRTPVEPPPVQSAWHAVNDSNFYLQDEHFKGLLMFVIVHMIVLLGLCKLLNL